MQDKNNWYKDRRMVWNKVNKMKHAHFMDCVFVMHFSPMVPGILDQGV